MDERNGLFREMQKNDGCFKTNEKNNKNERFKIVNKFEKKLLILLNEIIFQKI